MLRAMRLPLAALLILLTVPAATPAQAGRPARAKSAIFFYPWYSNPRVDGYYAHWTQGGRTPPSDLASSYFPSRGAYSSSDPKVLSGQMKDIASAGVDQVVSSWWGLGSAEDRRLPRVIKTAKRYGLETAIHLEPYPERTIDTIAADLAYFAKLGVRDVYVYRTSDFSAAEWTHVTRAPRRLRLFGQTNRVGFAAAAGFDGFYTYDILLYHGAKFERLCTQARANGILCAPSVGPGYDAWHATGDTREKPRLDGATYDSMWRAAVQAGADVVTITSYNEWGEGTQIEPAGRGGRYVSYDGAYGLRGRAAQRAYLMRTRQWTDRFSG
jgi:Glycosyl hydrolase family 99